MKITKLCGERDVVASWTDEEQRGEVMISVELLLKDHEFRRAYCRGITASKKGEPHYVPDETVQTWTWTALFTDDPDMAYMARASREYEGE